MPCILLMPKTAGDVEINYDAEAWESVDEPGYGGARETMDLLGDMPEGFFYPCCGEQGDADPCTTGRHRWGESGKKRQRQDDGEARAAAKRRRSERGADADEVEHHEVVEISDDEE